MNRTPTPWSTYQQQDAKTGNYEPRWNIHGPGLSGIVANIHFDLTQTTTTKQDTNVHANAAYIVQAVNNYEAMLEALESVESELLDVDMEVPEYITRAIAKAKGKETP